MGHIQCVRLNKNDIHFFFYLSHSNHMPGCLSASCSISRFSFWGYFSPHHHSDRIAWASGFALERPGFIGHHPPSWEKVGLDCSLLFAVVCLPELLMAPFALLSKRRGVNGSAPSLWISHLQALCDNHLSLVIWSFTRKGVGVSDKLCSWFALVTNVVRRGYLFFMLILDHSNSFLWCFVIQCLGLGCILL